MYNELMAILKSQPFRPFRIVMNNGTNYEVRHPEFMKLGMGSFLYFYASEPGPAYDRYIIGSIPLIDHVEFMEMVQSSTGRNGSTN